MTDQLSFDFGAPTGTAHTTPERSEATVLAAAEFMGPEPSPTITETMAIATTSATTPTSPSASDHA